MRYVTYIHDKKRGLIYSCKYHADTWKLIKVLCADHRCIDCPATEINSILDELEQYIKTEKSRVVIHGKRLMMMVSYGQ